MTRQEDVSYGFTDPLKIHRVVLYAQLMEIL